jgi:hypothetical protein
MCPAMDSSMQDTKDFGKLLIRDCTVAINNLKANEDTCSYVFYYLFILLTQAVPLLIRLCVVTIYFCQHKTESRVVFST